MSKDGLLPADDDAPIIPNVDPLCKTFRDWLKYNPTTGEVTRRRSGFTCYKGKPLTITAHYDMDGYAHYSVYINKRHYLIGHVVWCYMTGHYPRRNEVVLFVDSDYTNTAFINLRLMARSDYLHIVNGYMRNAMGVARNGNGYAARINDGKGGMRHLGTFKTEQEARFAYLNAKIIIRQEIGKKYGIDDINRVAVRRQPQNNTTHNATAAGQNQRATSWQSDSGRCSPPVENLRYG